LHNTLPTKSFSKKAEKFRGKKKIKDSQILEAFKESQDRVISMALIHEELHKGGKLDTLNISRCFMSKGNISLFKANFLTSYI
jgi:two-component sensor histidine kinase